MNTLKVTTSLTGMEELDDAIARAKEALDVLHDSTDGIYAAFRKVGLTVEQPPAGTEG